MTGDDAQQGTARRLTAAARRFLSDQVTDVFASAAQRSLERKEAGFSCPGLFLSEDLSEHFAHLPTPDIPSQNVVKGFIIDRIRFIEEVLGEERISRDTFLDIGDPDGIFLKALGKHQLSANISELAVSKVHARGIEAILCDAERLPFRTGSIDTILYFEILEHLENPIQALAELHRVAARSVVLSIPCVSATHVLGYRYNPDWPVFEHHVFEFDDRDLRNVVTHAGFRIGRSVTVEVMRPETVRERLVFLAWDVFRMIRKDPLYRDTARDLFAGCFRKFSIYYLIKV